MCNVKYISKCAKKRKEYIEHSVYKTTEAWTTWIVACAPSVAAALTMAVEAGSKRAQQFIEKVEEKIKCQT